MDFIVDFINDPIGSSLFLGSWIISIYSIGVLLEDQPRWKKVVFPIISIGLIYLTWIYLEPERESKRNVELPCQHVSQDDYADCIEYYEMKNDPCFQDAILGVPEEYSRCNKNVTPMKPTVIMGGFENTDDLSKSLCPNGCMNPKNGCVIKGNLSFNSGEKIYHIPGDEYYNSTKITSEYGERWFCTKEEAENNGWRRANN